jgi:cytidylate kinase
MTHGVKIIGLAGTNGSGKDTVGQLLAQRHNYYFISVTELLRDELTRRGVSTERENTRALSMEWRHEFGLSVLIDRAMAAFEQVRGQYDGVVMASLRNPYEADRIHELDGTVIWVDAQPEVRYKRIQENYRGRPDDNKTFEQFIAEEQIEMHGTSDAASLDMTAVKARADVVITNNSAELAALEAEVDRTLGLNTKEL